MTYGYDFQHIFENKTQGAKAALLEAGISMGKFGNDPRDKAMMKKVPEDVVRTPETPIEVQYATNKEKMEVVEDTVDRLLGADLTRNGTISLVAHFVNFPDDIPAGYKPKAFQKFSRDVVAKLRKLPYNRFAKDDEKITEAEEGLNGPHLDFDNIEVELLIHALKTIQKLDPEDWQEGELNEIPAILDMLQGIDPESGEEAIGESSVKKLADLYR